MYLFIIFQSALEMYTINAAYATRQENITGSLKVEKAADFIVINEDRDIFEMTSEDIQFLQVIQPLHSG